MNAPPPSRGCWRWALALALAAPAAAADFYLAADIRGSGDGRSPANAVSPDFFNAESHWSANPGTPGQIGPGDRVHLVGNIASPLDVRGSGRPGAPVTIVFDRGASMIAPAWPATGAIHIEGVSYIVVDGGASGLIGGPHSSPAHANGVIRATLNGSGLEHQEKSAGIFVTHASHIRIENLVVADIYRRTSYGDESEGAARSGCIWITWTEGSYSDFVVTNCLLHDAGAGVRFYYYNGSGYTVSHCTAYHCNWGASCGDGDPGASFSGVDVHDNYFHDWKRWDDPKSNAFHHNGFFCYAANIGSRVGSVHVHENAFGPGYTTAPLRRNYATSALYLSGAVLDAGVYNNLFLEDPGDFPSDGLIYLLSEASVATSCQVFNNTLCGGKAGIGVNITTHGQGQARHTILFENNLLRGLGTFLAVFNCSGIALTSDHNLAYAVGRPGFEFSWSQTSSSRYRTPSAWRSLGFDRDLLTADPHLQTDFAPAAPSSALGAGVNLSRSFRADFNHSARPEHGPWDIGALQLHATSKS